MPTENESQAERLVPGQTVRSISGRTLGVVGDVAQASFRLDTPLAALWLRGDAIFTIEGSLVSLICEEQGLPRFAV